LEIFEAGTGHGALTLNLARAIHAANVAAPRIPESLSGTRGSKNLNLDTQNNLTIDEQEQKEVKSAYDSWRSQRRAVVHTLDISEENSRHAQKVVRNFRKGLYYPHIDFHVGSVEGYLSPRLARDDQSFLDHAILDLPSTHEYLDIVGKALKPNGSLLVFCPSVTQIMECIKLVKDNKLPLFIEKTVEVGGAIGVGGREWDIRTVKPRALLKGEEGEEAPETVLPSTDNEDLKIICRPKVGVRISGGGFVGQFRKTIDFSIPNVE
jgi:tRNA (adenine57-N1/adenine58-N1)-methyltransferase